jgi:hypothetical protein
MLARVQSYLLQGIDALACEVEIDHDINAYVGEENNGSKAMVVGLPDASVKESIERVRSALANSGHSFPTGRALVNLAPADVRKEGPMYDLPIAVGLLIASGVIGERGGSASAVRTRAVTGGALANPERERGAGGRGGAPKASGGERPVAHEHFALGACSHTHSGRLHGMQRASMLSPSLKRRSTWRLNCGNQCTTS